MKLLECTTLILLVHSVLTYNTDGSSDGQAAVECDFYSGKPCKPRHYDNRSVVCVCTAEYCDELVRDEPEDSDHFNTYTSSKDGLRFSKSVDVMELHAVGSKFSTTLVLMPETKHQTVEGFGGAVTDSASINWKSLEDPRLQQNLLDSYFGNKGIGYNMIRVPIGRSDFSTRNYAYNEYPENDAELTNYTLAYEDYEYKLPMIKASFAAASTDIHIVASAWSPPDWMKNSQQRLKKQFYRTYALYYLRFLERYKEEGVNIWAITTTNEPLAEVMNIGTGNHLGWTVFDMGEWIEEDLGPMIRNSEFNNTKILGVDDQRFTIPLWFNVMIVHYPEAAQYLDGIAVHFYYDFLTPANLLDELLKDHPDKFILATEACTGVSSPDGIIVDLGSWERAELYITDIMEDLNHNVVGWIDWNLCLDKQGGPNWVENFVDSPIIVFPERGEFVKQPMFYALGHFSKFVPRGSRRIEVAELKTSSSEKIHHVAFLTPYNTVVVIIYNESNFITTVGVKFHSKQASLLLEGKTISTVEFPFA